MTLGIDRLKFAPILPFSISEKVVIEVLLGKMPFSACATCSNSLISMGDILAACFGAFLVFMATSLIFSGRNSFFYICIVFPVLQSGRLCLLVLLACGGCQGAQEIVRIYTQTEPISDEQYGTLALSATAVNIGYFGCQYIVTVHIPPPTSSWAAKMWPAVALSLYLIMSTLPCFHQFKQFAGNLLRTCSLRCLLLWYQRNFEFTQ